MNPMRTIFSRLSPSGEKGRLSVFIFHRVRPSFDPLFPNELDADRFDQMLIWIKNWFNVIPLDDAVCRLKDNTLPERAASITFDDGYADNREVALPILLKHNLTATFFIATGFLDGGRMWNDTIIESVRACSSQQLDLSLIALGKCEVGSVQEKQDAIAAIISKVKYCAVDDRIDLTKRIAELAGVVSPTDLMMTTKQLVELRNAGMQIGAHTVSHPILASVNISEARREMIEGKVFLENLLGEPIRLFAYPNGKPGVDFSREHAVLAKEVGFEAAVSTAPGCASSGSDPYQIQRFTPWDRTKLRFGMRLIQNFF